MKQRTNIRKAVNLLIKVAIIVLSYGFIYKKLFVNTDYKKMFSAFTSALHSDNLLFYFILIFCLLIVNWGIETLKWKFLIGRLEKISFFRSFTGVLAGITVSIFTPNRSGEFLGRVFILKKADPWEGTFVTIIGSISQLLITIIAGSAGISIFLRMFPSTGLIINPLFYYLVLSGLILVNILLVYFYFNISALSPLLKRVFRKSARFITHFSIFETFPASGLLKVLLLSLLRYCTFSIQFYLALCLFSVNVPFFECLILISVIYFIITAIPTVALSELGVRGSASLFVIGAYFESFPGTAAYNELGIISAATLIWLVNLVLPAIAGSPFVFKLRFFRKKK